jgi:hypothetical protein
VTLADLISGKATISAGNLAYSMFTYDPSTVPDMPQADKILVQSVQGKDGFGLQFQGLWQHTTDDGRTPSARLSYQVMVKGKGSMTGARLAAAFEGVGSTREGTVQLSESLFPLPCPD